MSQPTCRTCAHAFHPRTPCENRDFVLRPRSCGGTRGWVPLFYLEIAGVKLTAEEANRLADASLKGDPA